jgi:hypothetical protein
MFTFCSKHSAAQMQGVPNRGPQPAWRRLKRRKDGIPVKTAVPGPTKSHRLLLLGYTFFVPDQVLIGQATGGRDSVETTFEWVRKPDRRTNFDR